MSAFEYLGVLVSVVMGLGLTHLLTGVSKTIHHRDTLRVYWVHLMWALNVAIYIVAIWWGLFWWSGETSWTFFQFLFILLYAIVLFLLASLLFPWDLEADQDLEDHFWRTRPWFFSFLAVAWVIDIPETVMKGQEGLRGVPAGYAILAATHVTLALVGAMTSDRRFHAAYAVLWPTVSVGFLTFSTLNQIAG